MFLKISCWRWLKRYSARSRTVLGLDYRTDFAAVLSALNDGTDLPFAHDPAYVSPHQPGAS